MLKILFPVSALCSLSIYIFINIKYFGDGIVTSILILYFCLWFVSLFFNIEENLRRINQIKYSLLITILFLVYVTLRYLFDSNSGDLFQFTFGTTSGLILAFILGLSLSVIVSHLYKYYDSLSKSFISVKGFLIIFFLLTLYLTIDAFLYIESSVLEEVFLTSALATDYQRPGNLLLMSSMLQTALASMILIREKSKLITFLLYLQLSINIVLSQLFGSNNAAVSISIILVIFFVYSHLISRNNHQFNLSLRSLIIGKLSKKIIVQASKLVSIIFILLYFVINFYNIKLPNFRISSTVDDSIKARLNIFNNDFMVQFMYSPMFGNMEVHKITDVQNYPHSLLSIVTHLGITGFLFFLLVLFYVYHDIYRIDNNKSDIYTNYNYSLLRFFIVSAMIVITMITTFFVWMPFWFCMGLFGVSLYCNMEKPYAN